ncbi:Protein of unknown function [Gryllus bimaculatus]|nr:Protein of unknown function [Gryllus bimaculatus]
MASVARVVMAWMVTTSVTVSGAPLAASGARLRVKAGGNATCPWQVSLLDAAGGDGGRQLCSRELSISFGGERVAYENWSSRGAQSPFCGQINNDVWLLSADCSEWRMFVCEYDLRPRTLSAAPASLPVPLPTANCSEVKRQLLRDRGYAPLVGWNKTYVKDMGEISSWNEAKMICEKDGTQMVTIDSDEKADALFAFIESSNITMDFYIGVKTGRPVTVLGK